MTQIHDCMCLKHRLDELPCSIVIPDRRSVMELDSARLDSVQEPAVVTPAQDPLEALAGRTAAADSVTESTSARCEIATPHLNLCDPPVVTAR